MKTRILTLIFLAAITTAFASTVTYTPDDNTIFPNPERGFIDQLEKRITTSSPNVVKGNESYFTVSGERQMQRLVLVLYYLDNFKNTTTLPSSVLNAFDEDMQVLRSFGYKCILRYAYTNDASGNIAYDAPLATVQSHISQLKSHWQANADVIYVVQAGFIGAWGEWYYTSNFGNEQGTMNDNRRALVTALLDAVPQDRCIQLRTLLFKTGYVGDTNPLASDEAFSGTARARLAHHNDAFLSNYGDLGTYTDTAKQKKYIAQETLYVPLGGESCIGSTSEANSNASYAKTTGEMSRLHWTFCKASYSEVVTNKWRNEGTFDELSRKMGYRYQLLTATMPDSAAQGQKVQVSMQIKNTGYAPLYNERPVFIVLKNGNNAYKIKLQTDPRRWLPNGAVATINEQITIPVTVSAGTYQLYLYMPDNYSSIASDARYAVRFANVGVWDAATGMNALNMTCKVTGDVIPAPQLSGVQLPAVLDKNNVSRVSSDMTWYNSDYFDFGPTDAPNTERWAEWTVALKYPGSYIVSEDIFCENGHSWQLSLSDTLGNGVSAYTTAASWDNGSKTYDEKWNLSSLPVGVYRLRVSNAMEWGQPKLHSLTLNYDGTLPADGNALTITPDDRHDEECYDVLGRKVNGEYNGVMITGGKKRRIIK